MTNAASSARCSARFSSLVSRQIWSSLYDCHSPSGKTPLGYSLETGVRLLFEEEEELFFVVGAVEAAAASAPPSTFSFLAPAFFLARFFWDLLRPPVAVAASSSSPFSLSSGCYFEGGW